MYFSKLHTFFGRMARWQSSAISRKQPRLGTPNELASQSFMMAECGVLAAFFVVVSCAATPGIAQTQGLIGQGGTSTYGSYQPSDIDTINLQTGSVSLNIPLFAYPQKGTKLGLSFSLRYNSVPWFYQTVTPGQLDSDGRFHCAGDWFDGDPGAMNEIGVYVARDQGLTQHTERLTYPCATQSGTNVQNCQNNPYPTNNNNRTATYADLISLVTADGAAHDIGIFTADPITTQNTIVPTQDGTNFQPITANTQSGAEGQLAGVIGPDGITYTRASGGAIDYYGYPSGFNETDPEGNTVTISSGGWVDSAGRVIPGTNTGPGAGGDYEGPGGQSEGTRFQGYRLGRQLLLNSARGLCLGQMGIQSRTR